MKTEIPVIIYTGYQYAEGDKATNRRQQIEKLCFYLESVFNLLKRGAESVQDEARGNLGLMTFLDDVENFSEVGTGLVEAILTPARELESLIAKEKKDE